jgi:sugar phosphate isomerase/epimerase
MQVLMHINYFERGYTLEQAFERARHHGYDGIELRWKDPETGRADGAYLDKAAALRDRYGMKHVVFGVGVNLVPESDSEIQAEMDLAVKFINAAAGKLASNVFNMGAGSLVLEGAGYGEYDKHGSALADEALYERTARRLAEIADRTEASAAVLALETHNCYLHDLPEPTRKLLERTGRPRVTANFDMGNIILNSNGPSEKDSVEILKGRIGYCHMKNTVVFGKLSFRTLLEAGMIDNFLLVRSLLDAGFEGPWGIEYPARGDHNHACGKDIAYFRTLFNEVQEFRARHGA